MPVCPPSSLLTPSAWPSSWPRSRWPPISALARVLVRGIREAHAGGSALEVARAIGRGLLSVPQLKPMFTAHCEVAQRLAERFGFGPSVVYALGQLYERWDGRGLPNGLKGEAIAPAVLVVSLAQDLVIFHRLGGLPAALEVARTRKGTAYAPALVDTFCGDPEALCAGLDQEPDWEA